MPYDVRVYRGDTTLSLNRTQDALNDLDSRIVDGGIYIQNTEPSVESGYKYIWVDISGAEPVFNIHDGVSTFQGKLVPI